MRFDLLKQILAPEPRLVDVEKALRHVLRAQSPEYVEMKIGLLYGTAFKLAERDYDAGKGRPLLR